MKFEHYKSNKDLQNASIDDLNELTEDVRQRIINHIEKIGGHLGSNLAILELTISLLKNFHPENFRYIYDTGYQAYAFKMLTDRRDFLENLEDGHKLSIFQETKESSLDPYSGGHTSVSSLWAAGYNHIQDSQIVIEIIGDGSLATSIGLGGMLNFISHKKGLFILNDNKQGIGLNKFSYLDWEKISTGMDYLYYEVKNGHDFNELQKAWDFFNKANKSVFVKVNTIKANKYENIPNKDQAMHYLSKPVNHPSNWFNSSEIIINYLYDKLKKDPNAYVFLPGMVWVFNSVQMQKDFPDRVIDTGIAEEVSIIEAAAAANIGKKVYMMVFSTFFQRCYDQIVHDIMRNNSNINVFIFGTDANSIGDSHHGIYDLNMYNGFSNVQILNPSNLSDLKDSFKAADKYQGPSFIRLGDDLITDAPLHVGISQWSYEIESNNNSKVIIAYGDAFNQLKRYIKENKISLDLVEAKTLNPIDSKLISKLIEAKKEIYTYELTFWKNNLASSIRTKFSNIIVKDFAYNKLEIGRDSLEIIKKNNHMDIQFVINEILKK